MSVILHGSPLSPFTRKVTLVAMEKSIAIEGKDINPYQPPEYFAEISPLRHIPVLEDGDFILNDSSAISAYIDRAYTSLKEPLLPIESKAHGYVIWIEEYADTALFSDISEGVFHPIFINQLLGKPIDSEKVQETVTNILPERLKYLENEISGKAFFSEDRITLADVSVYAQLANLDIAGHLPQQDTYPGLMQHYFSMKERKTSKVLQAQEAQYLDFMMSQLKPS
ncbi:glutathione S-transferase family protein [Parasphingorhabdus sp.]|uniref:glutathione S-transferase family protein n=1 Tax=Parasphingorhabdus sp. TaxID=2709688 RepID=UPI003265697A